jgi:hypothetical protein
MQHHHHATLSGPCHAAGALNPPFRARRGHVCGALALCGGLLFSAPSSAHIDLVFPPPRASGFPDSNLRKRPCGQRSTARVEDKVSVFRPGERISVTWDVYVQHSSYFRIAFDLDGADNFSERSPAPADPERDDPTRLPAGDGELVLAYIEDKAGQLDHVEQEITLPSEACTTCTLQLIQFSYGLPLDEATYYQCADIVLEGEPVPVLAGAAGGSALGQPTPVGEPAQAQSGCGLGAHPSSGSSRGALPGVLGVFVLGWARRSGSSACGGRVSRSAEAKV